MAEKRTVTVEEKKGFSVQDLIVVAVLLAAGAVLKLVVGQVVNFFGMKPNFIIASYCLAILLTRPKLYQSAIIGLLAGAICQFLPGTPWLNLISELVGAVAMGLLIRVPMKVGKFDANPMVSTFLSTVLSGGTYTVCLFAFVKATTEGVVLLPSALAITVGWPPSITATQLFVVPRSIPIILLIVFSSLYLFLLFS